MEKQITEIAEAVKVNEQLDIAIKHLLKLNMCIKIESDEINNFLNLDRDSKIGFLLSLAFNTQNIILPGKINM